jgi:hypothetical protein
MEKRRRGSLRTALAASFVLLALCGALLCPQLRGGPAIVDRALGPLTQYALPEGRRIVFRGRVLRSLPSGLYAYLLIQREDGQQSWVVTLASSGLAPSTAPVRVTAFGFAEHFESKRLQREFPQLYFAVVRAA